MASITPNQTKSKPPYLLGLLCIIPLFGAFVGLGLLLYGLLRYKDKWLAIIGGAGILWTVMIYSLFFYTVKSDPFFKEGFEDLSQSRLNSLVKYVEFHKLIHGQYPDSLQQLVTEDKMTPINDPVKGVNSFGVVLYNYKKVGDKYILFSAGLDGIPNTKDDFFPKLAISDSSKVGLIKTYR